RPLLGPQRGLGAAPRSARLRARARGVVRGAATRGGNGPCLERAVGEPRAGVEAMAYLLVLLALVAVVVALDRLLPGPMARGALGLQRALGGLRIRSTSIRGFEIPYLDGGNGDPLVLVHGIGADKDAFAPVAPYLRGIGRVIALDLPGFGASSKPADADYSLEAQADRLGEFMDSVLLPRVH